jgi:hypothetical protein
LRQLSGRQTKFEKHDGIKAGGGVVTDEDMIDVLVVVEIEVTVITSREICIELSSGVEAVSGR